MTVPSAPADAGLDPSTFPGVSLETLASNAADAPSSRLAPLVSLAERPQSGVWLGCLLGVFGAVGISVAWSQTAGEFRVWKQIPYLISGGFGGLALIVVGVAAVSLASRRRDNLRRQQLLNELCEVVASIERTIARPSISRSGESSS